MWSLWTYHYGILFVVICVHLRGSGTYGGIGGMVGYMYCMWVEYSVVWYVHVFALCPLFPSRYTTSSIRLHTYVHRRTIKRASQRLADTIPHSRMGFSCGKACPVVAVDARLMVRPWTYVCRLIK
jgi:uncharacterized membrane protein